MKKFLIAVKETSTVLLDNKKDTALIFYFWIMFHLIVTRNSEISSECRMPKFHAFLGLHS